MFLVPSLALRLPLIASDSMSCTHFCCPVFRAPAFCMECSRFRAPCFKVFSLSLRRSSENGFRFRYWKLCFGQGGCSAVTSVQCSALFWGFGSRQSLGVSRFRSLELLCCLFPARRLRRFEVGFERRLVSCLSESDSGPPLWPHCMCALQ